MSVDLMRKVFEDRELSSTEKFVLLAIADNANDEGVCHPSLNTIAEKTSLSYRAVTNNINKLIEKGYLLKANRQRKNKSNTSNIYLLFPAETYEKLDDLYKEKFEGVMHEVHKGYASGAGGVMHEVHKGYASGAGLYEPSMNHHIEPSMKNKKNNNKKNKNFEKFLELLKIDFKNLSILTFKSKINKTKETKRAFEALSVFSLEALEAIAGAYAEYVRRNKKYAVRLDRWLVAYEEGRLGEIEYARGSNDAGQSDAIEAYFAELEAANNSVEGVIDAEVVR